MDLNLIESKVVNYNDNQQAHDLVELMDTYAKDPMGGGQALSTEVKQKLPSTLAKTPQAFSILCYVNGEAAGLINCIEGFSTFKCKPLINIHDLVVSEKFRRLGVSQNMLAKVETIARAKGCCKLTLEVLEGNQVAQDSYLKFGFDGYELDPVMGKALFWQKQF